MPAKDKILIVEDEKGILSFMTTVLTSNGYDVISANSGAKAITLVTSHCPDLVILDLGLPDMDGMEVLRFIRERTHLPIIVVSARTHERDKVEALDLGADDYVTKPFGTSELLARIRAALRHTRTAASSGSVRDSGVIEVGDLVIDYDKRRVFVKGIDARLTQNEYRIVALLGRFAGRVLTYDYLIRELWGPSASGDNQILRVNMANIRRKIEKNPATPEYIFTEVGVGYRMIDPN